ncbi:MAG: ribosomal protein L7/L12 [Dongiaceae bacterium]
MESIAQKIADLIGVDVGYGFLIIGAVIGLVVGYIARGSRSDSSLRIESGLQSGLSTRRSSTITRITSGGATALETEGQTTEIDPETMDEIAHLSDAGRKIEAIKRLREVTGLGLAEAKQLVEALERMRAK